MLTFGENYSPVCIRNLNRSIRSDTQVRLIRKCKGKGKLSQNEA